MASTLDPDHLPGPDRRLGTGHTTGALGPSDTSDSGSDMQGSRRDALDSDTDAQGTGEIASAGGVAESVGGSDIGIDRIDGWEGQAQPDERDALEDTGADDALDALAPRTRHPNRAQPRR